MYSTMGHTWCRNLLWWRLGIFSRFIFTVCRAGFCRRRNSFIRRDNDWCRIIRVTARFPLLFLFSLFLLLYSHHYHPYVCIFSLYASLFSFFLFLLCLWPLGIVFFTSLYLPLHILFPSMSSQEIKSNVVLIGSKGFSWCDLLVISRIICFVSMNRCVNFCEYALY